MWGTGHVGDGLMRLANLPPTFVHAQPFSKTRTALSLNPLYQHIYIWPYLVWHMEAPLLPLKAPCKPYNKPRTLMLIPVL
jgi:hypothetical protein